MESLELDTAIARLAHAFANPLRVRILEVLAQGERGVDQVRERVDAPLTSVSSQLKVLREARLVNARREGQHIYYSVADDSVLAALVALRGVAEARSLEVRRLVEQFAAGSDDLEHVDSNRLFEMMRAGETVLIDVRPRDEFEAGHIPGAVSMPLDRIERGEVELPGDARVVAYCRDAYCVLAPQAVRALRRFGVESGRLEIGFVEWAAQKRPVETTPAEPGDDAGAHENENEEAV